MNPYVCLHCNALTLTDEDETIIQCACGEAAWRLRCNCGGHISKEKCKVCGTFREGLGARASRPEAARVPGQEAI
jgi:hypothetical protein